MVEEGEWVWGWLVGMESGVGEMGMRMRMGFMGMGGGCESGGKGRGGREMTFGGSRLTGGRENLVQADMNVDMDMDVDMDMNIDIDIDTDGWRL